MDLLEMLYTFAFSPDNDIDITKKYSLIFIVSALFLTVFNFFVYFRYKSEKKTAVHNGEAMKQNRKTEYRMPDKKLCLISFFGPVGALAGREIFRHKTKKPIFGIVSIIGLILQILTAAVMLLHFLNTDLYSFGCCLAAALICPVLFILITRRKH